MRQLAAAIVAALAAVAAPAVPAAAAPDPRPNIVLIVTDDMAASDMRWMPHTRRLIGDRGVTMTGFLSNHPVCCPARAEILSGQYAQNNGTWHNNGPWGGAGSFRFHDDSLGAWLQAAGYRTGFVGKYLNRYELDPLPIPAGWTDFDATVDGVYSPWGFSSINNGDEVRHDGVYQADWVARRAARMVDAYSGDNPFFVYAAQMPPHGMLVDGQWVRPVPARRHAGWFPDVVAPSTRKPSFNVRSRFSTVEISRTRANAKHRARIQSLQAVDEGVATIVDALRDNGELGSTLLVFTSDNGFLLGEHRTQGKDLPYQEALQVPLLARGPGIPAGSSRTMMGSLADLAPTFLQAAQASPSRPTDGGSLLRLWRQGGGGNHTTLIQSGDTDRRWDWRGVRTARHTFIRFPNGSEMLFDRAADPYELRNVVGSQPAVLRDLRGRYEVLRGCAGSACVAASR